jgi:hypothetical protein
MPSFLKRSLVFLCTAAMLAAPAVWWLTQSDPRPSEPIEVLKKYLQSLYARDFRRAYRFISAADRELKTRGDYVRERGSFDGVALEAARKLSGLIAIRPVTQQSDGTQNHVKVALELPDANAVSELLLGWDEKRLNALPRPEQKKILTTIDRLIQTEKLPMIEGEEEFILVQEGSQWKIFLNWAAGIQVKFATTLPPSGAVTAQPTIKETVTRSGDLFTVGFKVKNNGASEILTRIVHRVEPKELAEYLDLVECALLLPVRLRAGEEQIFNSTYIVRGDLPEGTRTLDVTYEFKIEG